MSQEKIQREYEEKLKNMQQELQSYKNQDININNNNNNNNNSSKIDGAKDNIRIITKPTLEDINFEVNESLNQNDVWDALVLVMQPIKRGYDSLLAVYGSKKAGMKSTALVKGQNTTWSNVYEKASITLSLNGNNRVFKIPAIWNLYLRYSNSNTAYEKAKGLAADKYARNQYLKTKSFDDFMFEFKKRMAKEIISIKSSTEKPGLNNTASMYRRGKIVCGEQWNDTIFESYIDRCGINMDILLEFNPTIRRALYKEFKKSSK